MRTLVTASLVGLCLVAAGCSKPTQEKTTQDLKAMGSEVGSAAKRVTDTPQAKALATDVKQGASELASGAKDAASDAGDQLKASAKDAAAKTDDALNKAKDDTSKKRAPGAGT